MQEVSIIALDMLHMLHHYFRPLLLAFFNPNIPWDLRWRLFLLQPASFLTDSIGAAPYLFSRPFRIDYIPIAPRRRVRTLVFKAPGTGWGRKLRPLHIEIHGSAFVGGLAESLAPFDERVARETGAVVVSITYRFAPEYRFPAAIDDVDATIKYIQQNAVERWGADPTLMTVGGFSAGGNLALAAMQQHNCHYPSPFAFKAAATFYAAVDLRLRQDQKPRPPDMPERDPLSVLLPLFDAYAAEARTTYLHDPRLSPALATRETLPERMLMVIAGDDVLCTEQMAFAERVNEQDRQDGIGERVETFVEEDGFHGYLEGKLTVTVETPGSSTGLILAAPDLVVKKEVKDRAFRRGADFLRETYAMYGWSWDGRRDERSGLLYPDCV